MVGAIDYTRSNAKPGLHNISGNEEQLNSYQHAIMTVGGILEPYDSDRAFPFYGFGGIPKFMDVKTVSPKVDHCFPLNGKREAPDIVGIPNVMKTYASTISKIDLSSPTHFGPILSNFLKKVQGVKAARAKIYNVLMILTDGEINDMVESIKLIVDLSREPCSVIIIGVGNANFVTMNILDGDNDVLTDATGRKCLRDIVQFVAFNEAVKKGSLNE